MKSAKNSTKELFLAVTRFSTLSSSKVINSSQTFCDSIAHGFRDKVNKIYSKFEASSNSDTSEDNSHVNHIHNSFAEFLPVAAEEVESMILSAKPGSPQDSCLPSVLKTVSKLIGTNLSTILNSVFITGVFPT